MYYEERLIGDVLCWRGTPDGKWQPVGDSGHARLLERIEELTAALEAVEWVQFIDSEGREIRGCPWCEEYREYGHANCQRQKALGL